MAAGIIYGQTTYYWVGGTTPSTSISTGANWNTVLNGTGSSRPSSTGATDILVFDGSNVGGATPATGAVAVLANASITCAQIKLERSTTSSVSLDVISLVFPNVILGGYTFVSYTANTGICFAKNAKPL